MQTTIITKYHRFMKSSPAVLGVCVVLCSIGAASAQAQVKVGTVDMNKVFSGYYKTRDAETKLDAARNVFAREFEERMEGHKKLLDEIVQLGKDTDASTLSDTEKTERQTKKDDKIQKLQSLEQEIGEFKSSSEKRLKEQAAAARNQIVDEITKRVADKGKSDHYKLLLDKSGQGTTNVPVVLYSEEEMDVSDEIITSLNQGHPRGLPGHPATTAPADQPRH